MTSRDPRLEVLARSSARQSDPTAEVGAVLLGLVVSGSIALWALAELGLVPLTGVLVASSVLVGACGVEVLRGLNKGPASDESDPVRVLVEHRRAALQRELERWTRPTAWLISGVGSFLVISAGVVVLPGLTLIPAILGGAFLVSLLVLSVAYLAWGQAVRVPQLRHDLQAFTPVE